MARRPGRPGQEIDARENLIIQARELFSRLPYEKVSTRMLAEGAGVNMAMIRYYFGNKAGLFETMIRETMQPMRETVLSLSQKGDKEGFLSIMKTYYSMMGKNPAFPALMARIMMMEESSLQRQVVGKVFGDITQSAQKVLFEKMQTEGVLRDDLDPALCRMSYISLMVFPFIAPPAVMQMHGITLDEPFLQRLLEHNLALIERGLLNPVTTGESHEHQA